MPRLTLVRGAAAPLAVFAILALGWLVLVLYAYPGQMTQDSFDHLVEARAAFYTDGHPPALEALWRMIDKLHPGPLGMLLLQLAAFEAGLYLILRRTFAPIGAAIATSAVMIFPPVMLPMTVIWKDCMMAGFLVLGAGLLLQAPRWARLAGLAAMFVATAVRYNAFAAALPLIVLLFEWRPGMHWVRRYAISCGAWLAITVAAFSLNTVLTDQKMYVWHSSLAVYDIAGTLSFLDDNLPDAEMEQLLAGTDLLVHKDIHATLRALYSPRDFLPIIMDEKRALWSLPIYGRTPAPKPQRDAIARAWWQVVSAHPVAYAEHRLAVMAEVICLGDVSRPLGAVPRREFKYPIFAQSLGISTEWSPLQKHATRWMFGIWKATPIFVPWIYLALALAMLRIVRGHRDAFALIASGVLFESTLILLAPSPDYRYSHWMVLCTILAAITLTARRYRAGKTAAQPP